MQQAAPPPSLAGRVRCLGWENLELPFTQLSGAIVAALNVLQIPSP